MRIFGARDKSTDVVDLDAHRHRDVTGQRDLNQDFAYRVLDKQRDPDAVAEGRHPGVERELMVVDMACRRVLFTAFQYPDYWRIDVESPAMKMAGMKLLANSVDGFCVRTDAEAFDWMNFLGALATRGGAR
jgi:hypothetical protein